MTIYLPFTYLVRHKPTGRVYYGVRYSKGCHPSDLWNTYFTSSDKVKELIEQDGVDAFEYEIRRTFSNRASAISWEHKVLLRMGVHKSNKWINQCSWIRGYVRENFRHSQETKNKMSIAASKRIYSSELRSILSAAQKRIGTIPPSRKGAKWWNNGIDQSLCIKPPESSWVRGRLNFRSSHVPH